MLNASEKEEESVLQLNVCKLNGRYCWPNGAVPLVVV